MGILYNFGLRVYYLIILIVSIWNPKAAKWISGRKNWRRELQGVFTGKDRVIWFHCASLGEFEQGRSLIEKVRKKYPDRRLLLTFFSPSGYEKRKNYTEVDHVCYLPLDTRRNARDFLKMVPAEMVFFIKYEFWQHFLRRIHMEKISLYLASGNFQKRHLFFRFYGGWFRKVFNYFTHIFVQDSYSMELLNEHGINHVTVAGDTRFDRVAQISVKNGIKEEIMKFKSDKQIIIAGSTWEKDELLIRAAYNNLKGRCKWIIAPHEPSDKNLLRLKHSFPEHLLYTDLISGSDKTADVLIVNTIGHLSSLYKYGSIAYIGGGFGKGIHNILEATAAGLPVVIGPNFRRFREAVELQIAGAAYVVEQDSELTGKLRELLDNQALLKKCSQIAENYTFSNTGATDKIVDFVFTSNH